MVCGTPHGRALCTATGSRRVAPLCGALPAPAAAVCRLAYAPLEYAFPVDALVKALKFGQPAAILRLRWRSLCLRPWLESAHANAFRCARAGAAAPLAQCASRLQPGRGTGAPSCSRASGLPVCLDCVRRERRKPATQSGSRCRGQAETTCAARFASAGRPRSGMRSLSMMS